MVCHPQHRNDRMFNGLVRELEEEGRLTKISIERESEQTVKGHANGWISRLNALEKLAENAFVTPTFVVEVALDAPTVIAPESQGSNGSPGYI